MEVRLEGKGFIFTSTRYSLLPGRKISTRGWFLREQSSFSITVGEDVRILQRKERKGEHTIYAIKEGITTT